MIILPQPFQRFRQRLLFHFAIHMPSITGKNKLVMIALCGKYLCHVFISNHPIMHIVEHDIRIKKIPVTYFHPNAYWLNGTIQDEMFMKFPGAVWYFRVIVPLLVYKGTRIRE